MNTEELRGRRSPLSAEEVASLLGVSARTVARYAAKGWLPAEKHEQDARRLVYPVAGVRAFLKARVTGKAVKS